MKARLACLAIGILMLAALLPAHAAVTVPGCADASSQGGEWRSAGGSLSGDRFQPDEHQINASTAGNIGKAWVFRTGNAERSNGTPILNGGGFDNTPVVADGCVFLATTTGWVMALNADTNPATGASTGKQRVVWATQLQGAALSLRSNIITGSPTVENGVVYVGVTRPGAPAKYDEHGIMTAPATGPYVAALDENTGAEMWESVVDAGQTDSGIGASPTYFNGKIFQGWYGSEGTIPDPGTALPARGGYAILDASPTCDPATFTLPSVCFNAAPGATGGTRLVHEYTISDAEMAAGYRGASVWCTAAFDPDTNYLYACGGNPANKKSQSNGGEPRYANALLKIDGNPSRASWGKIVGSYKGNNDQYFPGLDQQPACDNLGDKVVVIWSVPCLQLDLDFGASPSLFKVRVGNGTTFETRTLVGDLQKSGVYHAVNADDMSKAWTALVGSPCAACNASSPAVDAALGIANQVYTFATQPGQLVGLSADQGRYRWVLPDPDPDHFESVTTANGVVYALDTQGNLTMVNASNGLLLGKRILSQDVGAAATSASSQGLAVARNSLYIAQSDSLIVLR
ncbi:MAG: PQQ-binding-like beta-propeller repeat protein [Actinomycetota bacterium]|nr:PQQ-binding-like beta-propeller repeat protein [Actinomycetota bacterium]